MQTDQIKAYDPKASVFVAANAGAGKTKLLAGRVLSLLLSSVFPAKILCLTYTHAASAEMSSRILAELGNWVMMEDAALAKAIEPLLGHAPDAAELARARGLFASVLEAPEGVRINTIHGFCQSLLRRFPLEAGISPHFSLMDARSEQELLKEARLRLLGNVEHADAELKAAVHDLSCRIAESTLQDLLGEIVANKRAFHTLLALPGGADGAAEAVWQRLGASPKADLLSQHFSYDDSALKTLRNVCAEFPILAQWLEKPDEREAILDEYVLLFLTKTGSMRQKIADALKEEQARVWQFSEARKSLAIAQNTTHLLHIAEALLALYESLKRARALLDYDDLILIAGDLLKRPGVAPWVLFKLDGGIDHVLIDEAQDTSPEQWEIVRALTNEYFVGAGRSEQFRSLFVVGDEKQSIFSFQGADALMLAKMQRYFLKAIEEAGMPAHRLALTHSYRSTAEVLSAVDAIFSNPCARAGLSVEENVLSHTPTRYGYMGVVELWPLLLPPEDSVISASSHLAREVASTIRDWLEQGVFVPSRARAIEPGDIMILVRRRAGFADALTRALKRLGVPVAGVDRMNLGDNLAVQDLLALAQFLLLPEDDLTLAALLKSPICNVSEEKLFALAHGREGTLWQRVQSNPAFEKTHQLLADLRAKADFMPPYELFTHALDTLGARARIAGRMGGEYEDAIDEFLAQSLLYEQTHTPSLQGFLQWLTTSQSEIKRDMEQAGGRVRIMTVHGAKGLQAPIVILPDTVRPPASRETLLWHEENGISLPLWPGASARDDGVSRPLRQAEKDKMLAEYRRLLYVALTRAEDHLYVVGAGEKAGEESWYQLVKDGLASIAAPFETKWGEGLRLGNAPERRREKKSPSHAPQAANDDFAFLRAHLPPEPTPPKPLSPSRMPDDEPASMTPLDGRYRRGLLIHALLQHVPAMAEAEREKAALNLARGYADMTETERRECVAEAFAVIADPQFAFLFAKDALAEAPLAGMVTIGGKQIAVSGQIDRLYIGAEEVWVVDFKTGQKPGKTPRSYLRQMLLYQRLLAQIYPQKTVRAALLWTSIPEIEELTDALLDEGLLNTYI